ncbi:ricin-type beta-trefoil lectin domain protein [Couchioplanes caeruleus]|uniref:ricin-type beta-trefoil lectin domain protein n=1 Tax=Couchioplanes caeruleus TaxID=56438 RepID=UPI0020C0F1C3|nr:ricin-type beta-trefoil lectin domain protein [Couchioplanes caeruleus]UQU62733.1 ricin-type beta-trefoil lectin domain protein [Couchioplanes caeruleus]
MTPIPRRRGRGLLGALALVVVAALGVTAFDQAASAAAVTGATIAGPGGKCVDVSGDDTGVNGTAVQLWDCQTNAADQHWTWNGTALTTIGRCLDVANGGTANGTLLQLWECNNTGAQQWVQQTNGSLKNPQSGRCVDAPAGATANGTRLQIYDCNGTGAQTFRVGTVTTPPTGTCPTYSDTPDLGPNVHIYDHSMSDAAIQSSLDSVFNAQKDTASAQFATRRDALVFKPSTTPYNVGANIGFNTSILGLGQNPDDVRINGAVTVDAFNASDAGNATQNFWRSAENMSVNTNGGTNRWAVAQAAPYRRMHVIGGLNLFPASYGWASGGYISDSKVDGNVESASQQQWYTKDSTLGSWSGSNWNMVFSGTNGAPATNFNTAAAGPRFTTLGTTPVSRDVPYLYLDSAGKYRVFLPSLRTNASGPSWAGGSTPGSSVPMSTFYVAKPGDSAATINTALANGCNVFFTPGIYHVNQTLHVTKANTVVLGIGYPTIIPDNGVNAMDVADVDGVRLKGLLFDAGTTNSDTLLKVGLAKSGVSHAANPATVQDVFFRIGGMVAGKATNSLVVNTNNTIIDHTWAWRADHGNGIGWTTNTADNGLTVNGDNVLATGLFVEHYQKNEVVWNGANGKIIFFQNEMPYDPPNQAAWMNGSQNGYPAIKVASGVTTFEAWGLGSYCFFNVNNSVSSARAFEVPAVAGVKFHDMAVVSLGGVGTISHIINDTGAAANPSNNNSYLVNFP